VSNEQYDEQQYNEQYNEINSNTINNMMMIYPYVTINDMNIIHKMEHRAIKFRARHRRDRRRHRGRYKHTYLQSQTKANIT